MTVKLLKERMRSEAQRPLSVVVALTLLRNAVESEPARPAKRRSPNASSH